MDLSLNLRAIVSQRLVPHASGSGRVAAFEILLGTPLISDLIFKGAVHQIKEVMAKSTAQGMCTFDQYLFDLYENDQISYEEVLRNADSKNELRLRIKLESRKTSRRYDDERIGLVDTPP
jgi:twitching motility protein PilU